MGCRIPCSVGDTKNTERVPKSLGDLNWGCQILGGAGFPKGYTAGCQNPSAYFTQGFQYRKTILRGGAKNRGSQIPYDIDEVELAIARLNFGQAPGLDKIQGSYLNHPALIPLLYRLFSVCFDSALYSTLRLVLCTNPPQTQHHRP